MPSRDMLFKPPLLLSDLLTTAPQDLSRPPLTMFLRDLLPQRFKGLLTRPSSTPEQGCESPEQRAAIPHV